MTDTQLRFPAEWEPQSAILIAWPHAGTDWAARLAEVEEAYIALVAAITRFQRAIVCVPDDDVETYAEMRLRSNRVDMDRVRFVTVPYDDTWLRDTGPVTLVCATSPAGDVAAPVHDEPAGADPRRAPTPAGESGDFVLLDFRFTGWGGKYQASDDDRLVERLHAQGLFGRAQRREHDFALEGGAIETDGNGTLLTTWQCLSLRHPGKSRAQIEATLRDALAQHRVLWLDHGALEGDDTDAHVDTLARFAPDDAIVFQACDDPADSHYAPLQAMAAEIAALRTAAGAPYRLFPLPWARPVMDQSGDGAPRRLAASYANFLVLNGAVLMPAYGDPADDAAAAVLAEAFPGREIVQVPCRPLIWQNGSLHCLTMQLPAGLVPHRDEGSV